MRGKDWGHGGVRVDWQASNRENSRITLVLEV